MTRRTLTLTLLLLALASLGYGQMIVMRDPTWIAAEQVNKAEERARFIEMRATYVKQLAEMSTQAAQLKTLVEATKDATKKLREINRRIMNYRNLEEAIVSVKRAFDYQAELMEMIYKSGNFSIEESQQVLNSSMNLLAVTSYAIHTLTVVLTDNLADMDDSSRLSTMNQAIYQLRDDLAVFNNFVMEIYILNNHRQNMRSLRALNSLLNEGGSKREVEQAIEYSEREGTRTRK
jgi:hypothetical protein